MKKFSIKFILISLIFALSIVSGNIFTHREVKSSASISFYGYNDNYTTEIDENNLVKVDINKNLTETLPSSYDLRDYIDIKVENQKGYGICYAYGSLTMLETYLALKYNEYYDFSEIHMATAKYVENGTIIYDNKGKVVDSNVDFDSNYGGGNFYNFYDYCLKGSGPVLEAEMPMSTFYATTNVEDIENKAENYFNNYKSEFSNIVTVNQFASFLDGNTLSGTDKINNRNKIKQHITTNGSCSASIYSSTMGLYNNTEYLNSIDASSNHMISIIGWDDNYKPTDWANAGAYLCLNSWGENAYGGVFYVSYDDVNIEADVYGILDAELNANNDTVSNYEAFLSNSENKSRTTAWNINSNGTSFISTVTDVSSKLNSYIHEISFSAFYPTTTTPNIYLSFTDSNVTDSKHNISESVIDSTYPSGKLSISSYSNVTNTNQEISGDTVFNIKLSTPVKITGKYAVLIIKTKYLFKMHGLESPENTNPLLNTYWNIDLSRIISADNTSLLMLTRFKTSNSATNQTNITGKFLNENLIKTASGYDFNNATYLNNVLTIPVENPTADLTLSNVQVYKVSATSTALSKTFETSNFIITKQTDKILLTLNKNIDLGLYLVKFTIGENVFYKSFEVIKSLDSYPTHTITYNLDGGKNNTQNLSNYSESLTELKIYHPTKTGYKFLGWYLDSEFNTKLPGVEDSNTYGNYTLYDYDLTVNLTLYARWELNSPTITTHPANITQTYTGNAYTLSCRGAHTLGAVSYQWYKDDQILTGQTNSSLKVTNVADSGKYKCKISYDTKYVYTNEAIVTINKATYNISWNYSSHFTYDKTIKSVNIINNYPELKYNISNNTNTNAGVYTANVVFTSWNENYHTPAINNLKWEIKPANITVNIKDALVRNMSEFNLFNSYSYDIIGTIYDDYDLNLAFDVIHTENEYVKIIDASYTPNSNYNVTINTAFIKIGKQSLSSQINNTNITTYNQLGYVTDAELLIATINEQDLSLNNQKFIEDNNLIVYIIYDISITDSNLDSVSTVSIDISKSLAEKNLKVYKITDSGMKLVNSNIKGTKLSFNTEEFGQFVIVEAPVEENYLPIIISVGLILLSALFCCFIVLKIRKHRNKKYMISIDSIPH